MKKRNTKDEYPGGPTWVDLEYDERLKPKKRFVWFARSLLWLRDRVLAAVIIFVVSAVLGIYIGQWLQPTQPQTQSNTPATNPSAPSP